MSNTIATLLLIAFLLTMGLNLCKTAIVSVDDITESFKNVKAANLEMSRTDMSIIDAQATQDLVTIYVQNTGKVNLSDFPNWDVMVHYYSQSGDYYIRRLLYQITGPGPGEWALNGISANRELDRDEVYEPGILNPGEVAKFEFNLNPEPGADTIGWVILSTPNGVTASTQFQTGEEE